jgi:carboxymethylenebutenolidase
MPIVELDEARVDVPVKGGAYPAFRALPRGAGPQPGLIVIHDLRGPGDPIHDVARRLARAGYAALGVDLFSRSEEIPDPSDLEALEQRRVRLSDDDAVDDLMAAERYLHGLPQVGARGVGALGFGMGGLYAYLLGCQDEMVRAVVDFCGDIVYGRTTPEKPISPIERAPNLRCPLLGIFGEDDAEIPVDQVRRFEKRLRRERKDFEIHVYPGCGHGFFDETRESYQAEAASDAWEKTLAFLTRHLRR